MKKQESFYPKGTIVAVSGLVKASDFGKSFNDPLIEVLENKNAVVNTDPLQTTIKETTIEN